MNIDTDEIALRIFCAMMSRPDAKVTPGTNLGENEVRVAFVLAETFEEVAAKRQLSPTGRLTEPDAGGSISG